MLEDGRRTFSEVGTVHIPARLLGPPSLNPQVEHVVQVDLGQQGRHAAALIVTRFADDFVVGFEPRHEAERFLDELRDSWFGEIF